VLLTHLPRLLDGHTPQLHLLPDFLLTLGYDVDWAAEKACFHSLAQALAAFYARLPPVPVQQRRGAPSLEEPAPQSLHQQLVVEDLEAYRQRPESIYWVVERVLFPALRTQLLPPRRLAHGHHCVQLAATEQLYRIFERC
jgi:DNA mismatch repair protein MLH1